MPSSTSAACCGRWAAIPPFSREPLASAEAALARGSRLNDGGINMKRNSKKKVYIVLHHEIDLRGRNDYVDDVMVFHVASSLESALDYIKGSSVNSYSWW